MEETICTTLVEVWAAFSRRESLADSAVGGAIAGVFAAGILGVIGWLRRWRLRQQETAYIRDLVTQGRKRVMDSKDTFNPGMGVVLGADLLRAAQYNLMIKQLDVALEHTTQNLKTNQRMDIYDALDWHHTGSLHAVKAPSGKTEFIELRPGRWPTTEMGESYAVRKFERLESIKWLKLKPYAADSSE